MTQRQTSAADMDRMVQPAAYLVLPTVIVVECGPFELHVIEDEALWCVAATGRCLTRPSPRARWGRA